MPVNHSKDLKEEIAAEKLASTQKTGGEVLQQGWVNIQMSGGDSNHRVNLCQASSWVLLLSSVLQAKGSLVHSSVSVPMTLGLQYCGTLFALGMVDQFDYQPLLLVTG